MLGHTDTGTGLFKAFPIFAVSKSVIVSVLMCDGTVGNLLVTAIADIRSFIEPAAAFLLDVYKRQYLYFTAQRGDSE